MDLSNPLQSVIPSAHGAVLAVLARTDEPLTGRGLAELTRPKFGYRRVNEVLADLAEAGIVLRERRPPSNLHRLNYEHVAAEGITSLARMWAKLREWMTRDLEDWHLRPEAAWLFGSAARGEAGSDSDIDVLLVVPTGRLLNDEDRAVWQTQTEAFTEKVTAWSGNPCELLEMNAGELETAVARDDPLIRDLRDHAVLLTGRHPRTMLRRKAGK